MSRVIAAVVGVGIAAVALLIIRPGAVGALFIVGTAAMYSFLLTRR